MPGVVHFLLPADHDVELSAISPAPCPSICSLTGSNDDNGLNSESESQTQLNVFTYKSYHGRGIY